MSLDENNRAAVMLLDDYLRVHNRLRKQRFASNNGKQPRRTKPLVQVWRAPEISKELERDLAMAEAGWGKHGSN